MKRRDETNEEFLVRVINFCPTGAIVQPFVLQALDQFSKAVIATGVQAIEDNPFVSGESWLRTAEFIQGEVAKHLKMEGAA